MKDYTTDTPEFSDRIKILETTDPGHADNVNVTTKQLLQNTLVNDRKLSEFAEVTDEDVENIISGPSGDVPEKKTPLTNLVNLIWTKWITPIKEGVAKKVDTSKIVKSTNITEDGFLMDGKTAAEEFAELNRKLPSDYYTESKSANISPNNWVTINSAVLKNGIYDVKANVSYSVSVDVSIVLSIETDPYTNTVSVRGSMGGGGGLYVSNLIDARNRNITVNVKTLHANSSVSEATSIFSYIRLC